MNQHNLSNKSVTQKYIDSKSKIPSTPSSKHKLYKNIPSVISSGSTIRDVKVLTDNYIVKRRQELFKRIKTSTLAKMIFQIGELDKEISQPSSPSKNDKDDDTKSVSNLSHITMKTNELGLNMHSKYIIIDVRDINDYDTFRITNSVHIPTETIRNDK